MIVCLVGRMFLLHVGLGREQANWTANLIWLPVWLWLSGCALLSEPILLQPLVSGFCSSTICWPFCPNGT